MRTELPDVNGRFGVFGGRFVPETLMNALIELEQEYNRYAEDAEFKEEIAYLLKQYSGRRLRCITPSGSAVISARPKFI